MPDKKILVVDDEPDFLEMIKMRLEVSGYQVITASNGQEALNKVELDQPDAVLLDIRLPGGIDGLEVLKRIRKRNKNLPVFILTSYTNREIFSLGKKFNAFGFIIKTNDLKKEIGTIESALRIAERHR